MKAKRSIPLFILILIFIGCNKEEESNNKEEPIQNIFFNDLKDKILDPIDIGTINYNLDFDQDTTNDIKITFYHYYTALGGAEIYIKVTPLNGYEVSYDDHIVKTWTWNPIQVDTFYYSDTVQVPKVYNTGDTIYVDGKYSIAPIMIKYSSWPTGANYQYQSGLYYDTKPSNVEFYYYSFRNTSTNIHKIAWLKLHNFKYVGGLVFNSTKQVNGVEFLLIE